MSSISPSLVNESSMKETREDHSYNLHFKFLPEYANFILSNKLREFSIEQLKFSRELNLPLLKYLSHYSEEGLIQIGIRESVSFLERLAKNQAKQLIEESLKRWMDDHLPMISRDKIVLEDIGLINLVRKKSLCALLPFYSNDLDLSIKIINEFDEYVLAHDSKSYRALFALQQSLYREAQALSNVGNWVWDLNSNSITWSEELYRIYELDPSLGITYNNLSSFNHPDDAERVKREMTHAIETGRPHDFYYRIILKNGVQKTLHARGEVKMNSEGKPFRLFGTLQDVTEQKESERAIVDKQNLIQKIADVTPSLIAAYNVNTGKYIFINLAIRNLLGYEPEEVMEKGIEFFIDLLHPNDVEKLMKENAKALEYANNNPGSNDFVAEFKYRLKHKNGSYRWFHTYGTIFSRNNENKVEEILNISVDVTQEHRLSRKLSEANRQIRQKDENFHRMIDEIQDYAILMLDKDGNILNWNKGAEKIKGYTADEIVGKNFEIFYPREDVAMQRPRFVLQQAIEKGKATDEGWRVRKDGSKFWASVLLTALHDDNNNLIGFSKITRDLTELKKSEDRLIQYANSIEIKNKQLESNNTELASFTYIASHDLREPLRKIKIFANRINDSETFSETGRDYFRRILSAIDRMQNLIDALLSYSRITSAEMLTEATDLNVIVNEVKENLREEIDDAHVTLTFDKLPTLNVVPLQFHQLFTNLIGNAIKYRKPDVDPVINISSRIVRGENASLPPGSYHEINISDNGIGFEQKYADRIFELFQRLHTRTEFEGTGIGLAICKKIVQNHSGFIKASSQPGKGSAFKIYLPVQNAESFAVD